MTDSMSVEQAIAAIDECADGTFLMTRDRCAKLRNAGQVIRAALEAGAGGVVEEDAAMEAWHSAVDDAGELFGNAPDERFKSRASRVVTWIKANRPQAAPKASEAVGVEYARRLAVAMHRDHYAADAPQWEPCPDLPGILSQIDNMLTGLTRTPQADPAPPDDDELPGMWSQSDLMGGETDAAPPVAANSELIGKLRCLGTLLQQLNAQTAATAVNEAIALLRDGLAGQEGAG